MTRPGGTKRLVLIDVIGATILWGLAAGWLAINSAIHQRNPAITWGAAGALIVIGASTALRAVKTAVQHRPDQTPTHPPIDQG